MARDKAGAVDAGWEAAVRRLAEEPLGDPLRLSVAVLAGVREEIEVRVLLAEAGVRGEDPIGGDEVERLGLVPAGQAQRLARAADVRRPQRRVRVDQVHGGAGVDHQVNIARQRVENLVGHPEQGLAEVPGDRHDAVHPVG
ncbi:MAG: hypothetical protein AVDCRST_MAG05-4499 [uncultured Rubrobacteraceae bacterium]|uniref:Uncharacterized protein n=1 Tax=uncultured Rubrobacteraceae bacterium TaxID=349277 RepID=A0A6J4TV60_9ACTN|nr:MAG: hypothetical protein AVDCRST_MAG05-4499 [uncultured Rubrobacteraceae bacterium]